MFGGISKKRLEHVDIWDVSLYQASFNFLVTAEGQPGGKNPARKDNNHPMVSRESSGIEWVILYLVICYITMENHHRKSEYSHEKW